MKNTPRWLNLKQSTYACACEPPDHETLLLLCRTFISLKVPKNWQKSENF